MIHRSLINLKYMNRWRKAMITLGVVGVAGGALSQGWEKILGSVFPGIVISWKHIQLNNIIRAIFHT